jgi:hypothetical protein
LTPKASCKTKIPLPVALAPEGFAT